MLGLMFQAQSFDIMPTMKRGFPFSLDKTSGETLTDQMVSGVRSAILRGFWKEGQPLPTRKDFVRTLGVSGNVIQHAMARLTAEGFVVSRPRIGCIVRRANGHAIRRLVLEVSAGDDCSFAHTCFLHSLHKRLAQAHIQCMPACLHRPVDAETSFRRARLGVVAALALVLLLVWIMQRRARR